MLQHADHVAPVGVQEVRQQAMRATTDLASNPLDFYEKIDVPCEGMPLVGTPADQTIGGLTLGVGTTLGDDKAMTRKGDCFGVVLDGIGEVLYNDHVVGTPPRVVKLVSIEPLREVSSFLAQLLAIIPSFACSVKPGSPRGPLGTPSLLTRQRGRSPFASHPHSRPNYSIWPNLALFRSENLAHDTIYEGEIRQITERLGLTAEISTSNRGKE